jgi:antitoxin component of RelBE/YafQ-DinJ toxin-antitoxin module
VKTEQVRIRIDADETARLKALAERFGYNTTQLAAMFVRAGMEALKQNHDTMRLPLKFRIEEPSDEQTRVEERTRYRK